MYNRIMCCRGRGRLLLLPLSLLLLTSMFGVLAQTDAALGQKCDLPAAAGSDFRQVRHVDLLADGVDQFSEDGVEHFSELLFDFPRYQVIVGARDSLYRLGLEGLTKLEKADWPAPETTVGLCTAKGQSERDCRNFVKVLVAQRDRVFACGTHAFSPKCSWREIEQINRVSQWIDGRGKCPYSPHANSSAHMTRHGDYYIGSATDFSSNDHAIYRMSGVRFDDLLRTMQYNSLWLDRPDFVGSFETRRFVYFVFRETAVEYINCGKAVYSRIARVCKNDQGGVRVLKDNWTTFLKARLNCSQPGEYPFYYNEIQSMQYLEQEDGDTDNGIIYATFSTGPNSILGSAVCSFNLSQVEDAFAGPFKAQSRPDSTWEAVNNVDHGHFECDAKAAERSGQAAHLGGVNSRNYQLVDKAVQAHTPEPLYQESLQRFTHIAVEWISTKHQDDFPVHVIFLATQSGQIKKLSFNTRTGETCLVEVLHAFPSASAASNVVHNMKFLPATNSLYVAMDDRVMRIPSQRCQRFRTELACLNAMDPYCGWNRDKRTCTMTPNRNPRAAYWQQKLLACPVLTDEVDGKWGKWGDWAPCDYNAPERKGGPINTIGPDTCMCRQRACNSPAPANGGLPCDGLDLEVANCTQHGQWTAWSEWSACSKTCDIGMRQRKRTCGNPSPSFGGRVCVGRDVDTHFCDNLPPCSKSGGAEFGTSSSLVREPAERWTEWSSWSKCSAECGRGFRSRTRKCFGSNCGPGCGIDFEECEQNACSDTMDVTDWTRWVKTNDSVGGAWYESRFRFAYRAPVNAVQRQVGHVTEEERFCTAINDCTQTSIGRPPQSSSELWTGWSTCTRECGTGYQIRLKKCPRGQYGCHGLTVAERACNTQPCAGQWGCWSEWSTCDLDGKRRRTRECDSPQLAPGAVAGSVACEGGSSYEEMECDGWSSWSAWDACEGDDEEQSRFRTCMTSQCTGEDKQTRLCRPEDDVEAAGAGMGTGTILAALFCGFVLGSVFGAGLVYYFFVFRRPGGANGAHGSPHYVSAKSQNLYVSLPMLDLKHKHMAAGAGLAAVSNQSDCGTLRSTLRSKSSSVHGGSKVGSGGADYETATIKRSHSQRNSSLINAGSNLRADLDSDQLFR